MVMAGAQPLEGLCHGPETDLKISSHAIQYLMPLLTVVATMAGYANEKHKDIELNIHRKIESYRQAIHDILSSDAIVMIGLACLAHPKSKEDREALAREPLASGSDGSKREPLASVHPNSAETIERQYQDLILEHQAILFQAEACRRCGAVRHCSEQS